MTALVIPFNAEWGASAAEWSHFDLVLGLTADLLPVVSNPRAAISPRSGMRDLGKVPSVYDGQRQVVGFSRWTQHHAQPIEIERWSREKDYGICLQTRRVRALDVDVTDAKLAERIDRAIPGHLPRRRRSNSSKFLVAFELEGEFTKRKFKVEHGIVEFLATGQQFISVGMHGSGVKYEWDGGLPDCFPVVTAGEFEEIWN